MTSTQINQENYSVFQTYMLVQIPENFDVIDEDDILYIDGTKYEAYANKMTFVWRKATDKFYAKNWSKALKQ